MAWATVYCDASFKNNKCGYSFFVAYLDKKVVMSGITKCDDSTYAEMFGAFKAITYCLANFKNLEGILINCDNSTVVDHLNYKFQKRELKNKKLNSLKSHIWRLLSNYKIKTRTKHVKGHQKVTCKRTAMNNLVDKKSRKQLGLK